MLAHQVKSVCTNIYQRELFKPQKRCCVVFLAIACVSKRLCVTAILQPSLNLNKNLRVNVCEVCSPTPFGIKPILGDQLFLLFAFTVNLLPNTHEFILKATWRFCILNLFKVCQYVDKRLPRIYWFWFWHRYLFCDSKKFLSTLSSFWRSFTRA